MNRFLRTSHRWLGMALVALTLANIVAISLGQQMTWLTYAPLAPLFLSMISGTWMFFQPYLARRRNGQAGA